MKKLLDWYRNAILSNYRWYRRSKGGHWFKIVSPVRGGFDSPIHIWTQDPYPDWEILKEEHY